MNLFIQSQVCKGHSINDVSSEGEGGDPWAKQKKTKKKKL